MAKRSESGFELLASMPWPIGIAAGLIATVGDYTTDAQRFAPGKPIELIHGNALLTMVRDVRTTPAHPVPSTDLSTAAPICPACPACGKTMLQRVNRRSRNRFWGCPGFPECLGTRPV